MDITGTVGYDLESVVNGYAIYATYNGRDLIGFTVYTPTRREFFKLYRNAKKFAERQTK